MLNLNSVQGIFVIPNPHACTPCAVCGNLAGYIQGLPSFIASGEEGEGKSYISGQPFQAVVGQRVWCLEVAPYMHTCTPTPSTAAAFVVAFCHTHTVKKSTL